MIKSGQRPLLKIEENDNILKLFPEDEQRELCRLNKVIMRHKAMIEEKQGKKLLRKLFIAASFGETLPELEYDEENLEKTMEELAKIICEYGDAFS